MIVWLDLETTGLEPKTGSILELAMVLTDDELVERARFKSIVKPQFNRGYEVMDEYVREMHRKSGLLAELYVDYQGPGADVVLRENLPRCGEVEAAAVLWLLRECKTTVWPHIPLEIDPTDWRMFLKKTPLGGNSVHFDRAWLKEHMPDLESLFSHRNACCSALNEFSMRWAKGIHAQRPRAGGEAKHRAMDDVEASIELARYYQDTLFSEDNPREIIASSIEHQRKQEKQR